MLPLSPTWSKSPSGSWLLTMPCSRLESSLSRSLYDWRDTGICSADRHTLNTPRWSTTCRYDMKYIVDLWKLCKACCVLLDIWYIPILLVEVATWGQTGLECVGLAAAPFNTETKFVKTNIYSFQYLLIVHVLTDSGQILLFSSYQRVPFIQSE